MLVSRRAAPAIVIDQNLEIAMLDSRLAGLLGHPSQAPPALRSVAVAALHGSTSRAVCRIETDSGSRVRLVLDASRVDANGDTCVILLVHSALEQLDVLDESDPFPVEYEILAGLGDFGRLVRVESASTVEHYWSGQVPRCHERIHHCSLPCADCPVLGAENERVTIRASNRDRGGHEVLQLEPRADTVVVYVQQVFREELEQLRLIRLRDALTGSSELTSEERTVAELLVRGESLDAIAAARGLSLTVVRRCEAAILRKLGLRTRLDLLLPFL